MSNTFAEAYAAIQARFNTWNGTTGANPLGLGIAEFAAHYVMRKYNRFLGDGLANEPTQTLTDGGDPDSFLHRLSVASAREYNLAFGSTAASLSEAQAIATAAAASAAEAALYGGKSFDTVADFLADTALTYTLGQNGTVTVGETIEIKEGPFSFEVLAFDDADPAISNANATPVNLGVIGDTATVKQFGYDGTAAKTERAQAALDWLGEGRKLVWDVATGIVDEALIVPDDSRWELNFPSVVQITQETSNTPIFEMQPTTFRNQWSITGSGVRGFWDTQQTTSHTASYVFSFNPPSDVAPGVYDWHIEARLICGNGYGIIGFNPAAAAYQMPVWGYRIDDLRYEANAVGKAVALSSPQPAGGPQGRIDLLYVNGTNQVAGQRIVEFTAGNNQLRIEQLELNKATAGAVFIQSSVLMSLGDVRIENASFPVADAGHIIEVVDTDVNIRSLEVQEVVYTGTGDLNILRTNTNGRVYIGGVINMRECTGTASGGVNLLKPDSGSICVGPMIAMQATDDYVQMYPKDDGANIRFVDQETFQFALNNVAASNFTPMQVGAPNGTAILQAVVSKPGFITGLAVGLTAAVTAGTLKCFIYKNGAAIASGAFRLDITSGTFGIYSGVYAWEPPTVDALHAVAAGDTVSILLDGVSDAVTGGGDATATLTIAGAM